MKYTSGPWEVIGRSIFQTEEAGGMGVLHGASVKGSSEDEIEANIRLIAAAPELLEALERLRYAEKDCLALRNWDHGWENWADVAELKDAQNNAENAIRKAKGE